MDLFYFTLKHGFQIVLHTICFLFIYFSMKFMYNVNRTSSDGRIAPAHFLLGYPNRQRQTVYILIILTMTPSPVGAGDIAVF